MPLLEQIKLLHTVQRTRIANQEGTILRLHSTIQSRHTTGQLGSKRRAEDPKGAVVQLGQEVTKLRGQVSNQKNTLDRLHQKVAEQAERIESLTSELQRNGADIASKVQTLPFLRHYRRSSCFETNRSKSSRGRRPVWYARFALIRCMTRTCEFRNHQRNSL